MKADYYPVQRSVNLGTGAVVGQNLVLDVARNLSVVNHRLYRQGKTYQVKIDLENRSADAGPSQYEIYALVDTWYVQKAWQLARAAYLRSTADERGVMSKQKIARWEDFRVTSGITGAIDVVPYRYSSGLAGAVDTDGEFDNSEITLADGVSQKSFTWGAGGASQFGILNEYDESGNTDLAPSTADSDNPYEGTDPGVHESQMDDLATRGNAPPYNATDFNTSIWVKVATLDNSGPANPGVAGGHSRMSTGFFNAPCGLVVIKQSLANESLTGQLTMTVKAGDYKGVSAMNMGV